MSKEELYEEISNYITIVLRDIKVIDELQQRIDKAIEYIKNDIKVYYVFEPNTNEIFEKTNKVKEDLLNILQGSDSNENSK